MWIIMEEQDETRLRHSEPTSGQSLDRSIKQMATLIIKIDADGQSYSIIKDRYTGETADQTPIDYLPDELKSRMAMLLRWANDVSHDD